MIDRSLNYGRPVVRAFLERSRPYSAVLDIGAGRGADLMTARALETGAALHAIEVWPPNVAVLEGCGVQVHALDLEQDALPLDDGSIDVVIANQILEHTKEIFWIFHEMTRVLRPGGHVVLGVPNLASFHNRLLLLCGRQPSVIKSASAHVRGFTRSDLLHFLSNAASGLYKELDHAGSNFYPLPPRLARPLAAVLPNLAWGLFMRLQKVGVYDRQFLEFPGQARLETNFRRAPRSIEQSKKEQQRGVGAP